MRIEHFWTPASALDYFFPDLSELGPDPTRRYTHGDRLDGTDFIVGHAVFFGDPKEMLHSRVASQGEGHGQLDHRRHFLIQYVIVGR